MHIKTNALELNRMLKIITQCISTKDVGDKSNIELIHSNNMLMIHSSDGHFTATMQMPVLGGDGESFCVDGTVFARVCSMCSGMIEIITDGKFCTVKGAGRTRIPIVDANIPKHDTVEGKKAFIDANSFSKCFNNVAFAVSSDQTRIQLTGVLVETGKEKFKMSSLDGFQLSVEESGFNNPTHQSDEIKMIVPASFMKLVSQGAIGGEFITFYTNGKKLVADTDSMMLSCGLLTGQFPDIDMLMPKEFKTECLIRVDEMLSALKSGSVVNNKQNLIKLEIGENNIRIMNNSEEAEFEADVKSETNGPGLKIAFNLKYLINVINSFSSEEAVMHFNTSVSPCVLTSKESSGVRLLLPVRVQG